MDIQLKPGSYVVAVSGGVDSVALLHQLQGKPGVKLVVAHYDHGIRDDSRDDRLFVQELAHSYSLPFVYDEGRLGLGASEAMARKARYNFLQQARQASASQAIVTAHHQDDLLETALINILRGSGRKGLSSLNSRPTLERPLLHVSKQDLIAYAKDQGLVWREDSTNQNTVYLRNYVRQHVLPRFGPQDRAQLIDIVKQAHTRNREIDTLLANQLYAQSVNDMIDRQWFNHLPHSVAREAMATWLRAHDLRDFDSKGLERLVVAAKVAHPGAKIDVLGGATLEVGDKHLALTKLER